MDNNQLGVSVVMITYGHENYLKQAIDGVLMQKGNFNLELIIADDRSPDNTSSLVESIIESHPQRDSIKYFRQEKNIGIVPNFLFAMSKATQKYIAICEGDDYWTDENKIQTQINFLEENEDFSTVCHNALKYFENQNRNMEVFYKSNSSFEINIDQLLSSWIIPTASMFFRADCVKSLPDWFNSIYSADFSLSLILFHSGKIYFMNQNMSVYRINFSGHSATASFHDKAEFFLNQHQKLMMLFNEYSNYKYDKSIQYKLESIKDELIYVKHRRNGMLSVLFNAPNIFLKKAFKKLTN